MRKHADLGSVFQSVGRHADRIGQVASFMGRGAAGLGGAMVRNPLTTHAVGGAALGALGAGEGNRMRGAAAGAVTGMALPPALSAIGQAGGKIAPQLAARAAQHPMAPLSGVARGAATVGAPMIAGSMVADRSKAGSDENLVKKAKALCKKAVGMAMPGAQGRLIAGQGMPVGKQMQAPKPVPSTPPVAPAAMAMQPPAGGVMGMPQGPVMGTGNMGRPQAPGMAPMPSFGNVGTGMPKRSSEKLLKKAKLVLIKKATAAGAIGGAAIGGLAGALNAEPEHRLRGGLLGATAGGTVGLAHGQLLKAIMHGTGPVAKAIQVKVLAHPNISTAAQVATPLAAGTFAGGLEPKHAGFAKDVLAPMAVGTGLGLASMGAGWLIQKLLSTAGKHIGRMVRASRPGAKLPLRPRGAMHTPPPTYMSEGHAPMEVSASVKTLTKRAAGKLFLKKVSL